MEMGAYTQLSEPKAKEEAQKELKGKQLSLFDEHRFAVSKPLKLPKPRATKPKLTVCRQLQQQQAAELKASQAKLKKFLGAKQGELTLEEAPPAAGVAVEGQPDHLANPYRNA